MPIPCSIANRINGKVGKTDSIGKSDSSVTIYDDCVLKISDYRADIDKSVDMMRWMSSRLPTPKVIEYEICEGKCYLLMSKIEGAMACDNYYMEHPKEMLKLLADGLNLFWATDISCCPRERSIDIELQEARYRIDHGMVDMEDAQPTTFGEGGFKDPEELYQWLVDNKPEYEPVLSHGDYCLPNVFFNDGRVSGFIDLGDSGIGDKWRDIALCYRSLINNFGGVFGGKVYEDFNPDDLFNALGMQKNEEKLKFYILLDELF